MTAVRAGDSVIVRSKEEILRTLDKNGRLDGMPFMPQMFEYCGKRPYQTVAKQNPKECADQCLGDEHTQLGWRQADGCHRMHHAHHCRDDAKGRHAVGHFVDTVHWYFAFLVMGL